MNDSMLAAQRFVRSWAIAKPKQFNGVNTAQLIDYIAKVHSKGGITAVSKATGISFSSVEAMSMR